MYKSEMTKAFHSTVFNNKEEPIGDILWGLGAIWVFMPHTKFIAPFHSSDEAMRYINENKGETW